MSCPPPLRCLQAVLSVLPLLLVAACVPALDAASSNSFLAPTLPPPMATATPTLPPPTATCTAVPQPTLTPVVTPLCAPASSVGDWECREYTAGRVHTRSCAPAPLAEAQCLCYEDLDYGIALEYPASLEVLTPDNWAFPERNREALARRQAFDGAMGHFELQIWLASEPDLASWLQKMRGFHGEDSFPAMAPNATVGGHPAVAFIEPGYHYHLTVILSDGAHVYRLRWLRYACEENGLPTVRRILDSVRTLPEPVPAEIPDDIWQQAARHCTSKVGTRQ